MGRCDKLFITDIPTNCITDLCVNVRQNKVKRSQELFRKLPPVAQCIFLETAWKILSKPTSHSSYSLRMAYYIFKLFRSRTMRDIPTYAVYARRKTLDKLYKQAKKKIDAIGDVPELKRDRKRKVFEKKFQKREMPGENDPLSLFYISAYEENPDSLMAIKWLTEHGFYEGKARLKLEEKYECVKNKSG